MYTHTFFRTPQAFTIFYNISRCKVSEIKSCHFSKGKKQRWQHLIAELQFGHISLPYLMMLTGFSPLFFFFMTDVPTFNCFFIKGGKKRHFCRFFNSPTCHLAVLTIVWAPFSHPFCCNELCHSLMISTFVVFVFCCTSEVHLFFHLLPIHAWGNSCALLWGCSAGFQTVGFLFILF